MPKLRQAHLPDRVTILSSGAGAGWSNFEFQEVELPREGVFEGRNEVVTIYQTCGPLKVRLLGRKKAFHDLLPYPRLKLPGEGQAGAWLGVQRSLCLLLEPAAIERLTHLSFHEHRFRLGDGPDPVVEHLLRALHIDARNGHPCGPMLGEVVVTALLHRLLPSADPPARTNGCRLPQSVLERVRGLIEANLARSISLEELAHEAGISVRHLCRTFQSATGCSPYRYILIRRVDRAKLMIQDGHLSLRDVAATVGFASQAHMADTFRKVLGVKPSHFSNNPRNSR